MAEARRANASISLISRTVRVVAAEARNTCSISLRGARRIQRLTRWTTSSSSAAVSSHANGASTEPGVKTRLSSRERRIEPIHYVVPPAPAGCPRHLSTNGAAWRVLLLAQARRSIPSRKDFRFIPNSSGARRWRFCHVRRTRSWARWGSRGGVANLGHGSTLRSSVAASTSSIVLGAAVRSSAPIDIGHPSCGALESCPWKLRISVEIILSNNRPRMCP